MRKIVAIVIFLAICNSIVFIYLNSNNSLQQIQGNNMLNNGITLVEKKRDFTGTVTVSIFIKGGLFTENKGNNGIGNLMSRVWVMSNKILETSEFYGSYISAKLTPYALEVSFSAPTEVIDKIYSDFEQFILAPEFDKQIFDREKSLMLEELVAKYNRPNNVAYDGFMAAVFDGMPYAMPTSGKKDSVENISFDDIKKYYKEQFVGANMVVSVAGKYDQSFVNNLKATLSKFDKGELLTVNCDNSTLTQSKRIEETDNKIQQAKLYIGYNAPDVSSPDYPALKVLTELLGGGMSSRYFEEIRKNSGYAYSVGAGYPSRMCSSRFFISAGLDYANVESALQKFDDINMNLESSLTDEEIERAKRGILGSALMETQTNSSVAWNMAFFETMGLGADYYDKYVETLKTIDKQKILKAAESLTKEKVIYILKPSEAN